MAKMRSNWVDVSYYPLPGQPSVFPMDPAIYGEGSSKKEAEEEIEGTDPEAGGWASSSLRFDPNG